MIRSGNDGRVVLLAHGDGGLLTRKLIDDIFLKHFNNRLLERLSDAAVFEQPGPRTAFTIDSFVVDPIFFPGGDIGKLAICGTVNDLAVSGAVPLHIAASFIIEEGFLLTDLERIAVSMAQACREAGVFVAAGDTKVVPRGCADKVFITSSGLGVIPEGIDPGYHRPKPGDLVVVNGGIGNHGLAILSAREGLGLEGGLASDCAPLNVIIGPLLKNFSGVKIMRDLTRGGLATSAVEIAGACGLDIVINESLIPVDREVAGAAEMLGLDPLYLANEGKFMAVFEPGDAVTAVEFMRKMPYGHGARVIGEVRAGNGGVYLETTLGGTRLLDQMAGSPLPRIC